MKIHVPANFIGYGSFALSAMVSVAYLLKERGVLADRLPSFEVLDDVMYKSIAVGFAFFTVATILGALWAAQAWGGYWSWDPKENLGADRLAQLRGLAAYASDEGAARLGCGLVGAHRAHRDDLRFPRRQYVPVGAA